jgi:hypothetical protein
MSQPFHSPSEEEHRLHTSLSRRSFLKSTAVFGGSSLLLPVSISARPTPQDRSETLAAQLYRSLDDAQRALICHAFEDPLRQKVDNNWLISKKSIRECLKPDQCDLVRQIFRHLHSPEFADRAMEQMVHDSEGKGFDGGTSVALFGKPGTGKFEFVLTGRHCTRRCDGDSSEGAAFGGPIFYGHQAGSDDAEPADHPGNVFWFQAKRVNEVFRALSGKQRSLALVDAKGRPERATQTVQLTGKREGLAGLPLSELTSDQRGLVNGVLRDLLSPFRKQDAEEAMKLVQAQGLENLSLALFKRNDVGNDGVWDVWQIEGPNMLWYFRGDPHVHCWVHIRGAGAAASV